MPAHPVPACKACCVASMPADRAPWAFVANTAQHCLFHCRFLGTRARACPVTQDLWARAAAWRRCYAKACTFHAHVLSAQVGERTWVGVSNGTCPADCPVPFALCPLADGRSCGGRGRCFASLGLCDCFAGCACALAAYLAPCCVSKSSKLVQQCLHGQTLDMAKPQILCREA